MSTGIDEQYYEVAAAGSIAERVMMSARNKIYVDFMHLCAPGPEDTILDFGVSAVIQSGDNMLERSYPYPHRITAVGLDDGKAFGRAFPQVAYRQIEAGAPLPFPDKHFRIALSNAVLEHAGSVEAQRRIIAELLRVARTVFLTVPNRYFPVEHHTALPLAAWCERTFALACRLSGRPQWADRRNLILMSRKSLTALIPDQVRDASLTGWTGLRLGPCSSNIFLRITTD